MQDPSMFRHRAMGAQVFPTDDSFAEDERRRNMFHHESSSSSSSYSTDTSSNWSPSAY